MQNSKKIVIFIFTTLLVTTLFSCESNFREIQKSTISEFTPTGEADSINLKYTDSGRIKSELISPKMLDYSTVKFPFTEFPKGISVTIFDQNGKKTFVEWYANKVNEENSQYEISTKMFYNLYEEEK